jgi:hypothetical protein
VEWKEAYEITLLPVNAAINFGMPQPVFIKLGASALMNDVLHKSR